VPKYGTRVKKAVPSTYNAILFVITARMSINTLIYMLMICLSFVFTSFQLPLLRTLSIIDTLQPTTILLYHQFNIATMSSKLFSLLNYSGLAISISLIATAAVSLYYTISSTLIISEWLSPGRYPWYSPEGSFPDLDPMDPTNFKHMITLQYNSSTETYILVGAGCALFAGLIGIIHFFLARKVSQKLQVFRARLMSIGIETRYLQTRISRSYTPSGRHVNLSHRQHSLHLVPPQVEADLR
jgi:hypothetical protein